MWKNNEYKINLKEDSIYDFERIMLSSGECQLFMPMVFMDEMDHQTAYYDCGGFSPLNKFRIDRTEDALYILEKTLLILSQSVEYLLTPARVTLTTETVFYEKESGEIKIAYVPMTGEAISLRRNLITFIAQIKSDVMDGHTHYLDELANLIYRNNYHIRDIINKTGLMRRDLYQKTKAKEIVS